MNKNIQALADQCRVSYRNGQGGYVDQFDEEKFAELIILRCCEITDESQKTEQPVLASKFVKAHFGIERS